MIFVLTILERSDLELPFFGQALFHVFLLAFVFLFIIADIFRNIPYVRNQIMPAVTMAPFEVPIHTILWCPQPSGPCFESPIIPII